MEKYYEEWNGEKFPVRIIEVEELGIWSPISVADYELWSAIQEACEDENSPMHMEAIGIDSEIYYYFDSGFIASNPTDEVIVGEIIKLGI